jgi:phosphatidylglycerophosphate synthase
MKVSKETIFTPANAISLIGLALVVVGSANITTQTGVLMIIGGRAMDLIDGYVARATKESDLGAAIDATFDKLAVAAILVGAILQAALPLAIILWVLIQNLLNSVISIIAAVKGHKLETSIEGKRTMFLQNVAIGLLLVSNLASGEVLFNVLLLAGMLAAIVSVPLGVKTTINYLRQTAL